MARAVIARDEHAADDADGYVVVDCLAGGVIDHELFDFDLDEDAGGIVTPATPFGFLPRNTPLQPQDPPALAPDEAHALLTFRAAHGPGWKKKLAALWTNEQDLLEQNGALLRQIRNRLGPWWLATARLPNP